MSRELTTKLIPPAPTSRAVSAVMRANRGQDTKLELIVRKLLFSQGYRYRVHMKALPGRPDIVFTRRKKVIFLHGCFWHQHPSESCPLRCQPKSNTGYWSEKFRRNVNRDASNEHKLRSLGWELMIIWECETRDIHGTWGRLKTFLGPPTT